MTCSHCNDTGISSGAPDDIGAGVTMSPCECDAGLAWVALGGDMTRRIWLWDKGYHAAWYARPEYSEVVPMSAYRAQRDSIMAMLRDANDKLDWAQTTLEVMGR